jgi:hypothetical protein
MSSIGEVGAQTSLEVVVNRGPGGNDMVGLLLEKRPTLEKPSYGIISKLRQSTWNR